MTERNYHDFVGPEANEVASLYFKLTGRFPSPSDLYHNAWRALHEGKDLQEILRLMREEFGGNTPVPPGPIPPPTDEWEKMVRETIDAAFREAGRGKPTEEQVQFILHKCRHEGWSHVQIQAYVASLPVTKPKARTGVVSLERRSFVDEQGPFFAMGTTFFWAVRGMRHEQPRFLKNVEYLAGTNAVDYARILSMVAWNGLEIDPFAPDHFDILGRTVDSLYDNGIRTQLTVFADAQLAMPNVVDREQYVDAIAEFVNDRLHKIQFVELVNEYPQNGFDIDGVELRGLTQRMSSRCRALVASSTPWFQNESKEEFKAAYQRALAGSEIGVVHFSRDFKGDGPYRPIRQPWEYQFEVEHGVPEAFVNNEPIGIRSSVMSDEDPGRLVLGAICTALSGGAGYCLHTGAGVAGVKDPARGREANFWEQENIVGTFNALAKLGDLLPGDISNWRPTNWSPNWNPPMRFLGDAHDYEGKIVRSFASVRDNKFFWAPMGVRKPGTWPRFAAAHNVALTFYNPATMERVDHKNLTAGQEIDITGDFIIYGEHP
jgi:hypothetical protein